MTLCQCFQHIYSISPVTLRQLPWLSPIKISKIVETFLEKFSWWNLAFINLQGNITEANLQHWHFSWKKIFFFQKIQPAQYTEFVRFSKATSCSHRASNFTLNNVFSILALSFSLINVTGVMFHFITQE